MQTTAKRYSGHAVDGGCDHQASSPRQRREQLDQEARENNKHRYFLRNLAKNLCWLLATSARAVCASLLSSSELRAWHAQFLDWTAARSLIDFARALQPIAQPIANIVPCQSKLDIAECAVAPIRFQKATRPCIGHPS